MTASIQINGQKFEGYSWDATQLRIFLSDTENGPQSGSIVARKPGFGSSSPGVIVDAWDDMTIRVHVEGNEGKWVTGVEVRNNGGNKASVFPVSPNKSLPGGGGGYPVAVANITGVTVDTVDAGSFGQWGPSPITCWAPLHNPCNGITITGTSLDDPSANAVLIDIGGSEIACPISGFGPHDHVEEGFIFIRTSGAALPSGVINSVTLVDSDGESLVPVSNEYTPPAGRNPIVPASDSDGVTADYNPDEDQIHVYVGVESNEDLGPINAVVLYVCDNQDEIDDLQIFDPNGPRSGDNPPDVTIVQWPDWDTPFGEIILQSSTLFPGAYNSVGVWGGWDGTMTTLVHASNNPFPLQGA